MLLIEKTFEIRAEGRKFAKKLRKILFGKGKVRTVFKTECFFNWFLEVPQIQSNSLEQVYLIQIGKNIWDIFYRKSLKKYITYKQN